MFQSEIYTELWFLWASRNLELVFLLFFVMPAFAEVFNQALQFKLARRIGHFRLPQSSPIAHKIFFFGRAPLPTWPLIWRFLKSILIIESRNEMFFLFKVNLSDVTPNWLNSTCWLSDALQNKMLQYPNAAIFVYRSLWSIFGDIFKVRHIQGHIYGQRPKFW